MSEVGIDYAWQHPAPDAIRAAGYTFVVRYLSRDTSKNLTASERDALHAHGLDILLVWETSAKRAGEGKNAGLEDVMTAEQQAAALGYPLDCPIFYAVDFDATPAQVQAYFNAVRTTANYPVGLYGGIRLTDAKLAPYNWQTAAWSGGKVSQTAHLYQRLKPTRHLKGGGFDEDALLRATLPMWGAKPKPKPKPKSYDDLYVGTYNIRHTLSDTQASACLLEVFRSAAGVVGFQESAKWLPLLDRAAATWSYFVPQGGDNASRQVPIAWRKRHFNLTDHGSVQLHPKGKYLGGLPPEHVANWVELEHVHAGRRIIVVNLHTPASSTVKGHPLPLPRAALYREGMTNLATLISQLRSRGIPIITVGDFNVDAKADEKVQAPGYPHAALKGQLHLAYDTRGVYPRTHGANCYDQIWYHSGAGLKFLSARALPKKASDHSAVVGHFRIRSKATS